MSLSLHHMTRGLRDWAQTHMAEALAHRENHDARTARRLTADRPDDVNPPSTPAL